jgi:hypothetical protein
LRKDKSFLILFCKKGLLPFLGALALGVVGCVVAVSNDNDKETRTLTVKEMKP